MGLQATSQAAAVGAAVKNVQFKATAETLPRKILIIGQYDAAKTAVVDYVPVLVTSPEDAGDKFGFGFMAHRLAQKAFAGSNGVETWIAPMPQPSGTQASGDITFAGTASAAGTLYLYIAGDLVRVVVAKGTTHINLALAVITAVNAIKELPVTAATGGDGIVNLTAKDEGPWGNEISIVFNLDFQEEFPAGISAVVTDMASGAGLGDIDDALDELGTGDASNEAFFTDMVHGYLQDTTTLGKISAYIGPGNDFVGCYSKVVARPFRALTGDVAAGSSGLSDLITLANTDKLDRANGVVAAPGSPNHPSEIAAVAIGIMAKTNNDRGAESYIGKVLPGIIPGEKADRWSDDYDSRDTAVKTGISPTIVENGAVVLQNVMTFYHPDGVPVTSNGYRSQRNISIIQNILYNIKLNFSQEKWKSIIIVEDITKVSNNIDRQKARDIDAVLDDLVALAVGFEGHAWLYTAAFTISRLQAGGLVEIRPGGTGFNSILPVILSGEGGIIDTLVEFDTSLAVLTQ
jgi:phage tail sheath gpL-like